MSAMHDRLRHLTDDQRRLVELRLAQRRVSAAADAVDAPRGEEAEPVLSHAQRRFWWLHQLDPAGHSYNTHAVVEIAGDLSASALRRSFTEIVRRHSVLRTTFPSPAGVPVPAVAAAPAFDWDAADLVAIDESDRLPLLDRLVGDAVRAPFDLAAGPLLRARLWRLDDSTHRLAIVKHHIVSDRWSMALLVRELAVLYDAFAAGEPSPLPDLERQHADFAREQEAMLRSASGEAHTAYWRRQLGGELVPLRLPVDRPAAARRTFAGACAPGAVPPEVVDRLLALGQRHNATLFMVCFAAFVALLHRYSGQSDVIVGVPVSGRRQAYAQSLIGCFIDTLPLRCDAGGNPAFRLLLERVRQTCLDAFSHQDLPFERIVELLNPDRSAAAMPFFRVMFTLNDVHDPMSGYGTLTSTLGKSGLQLRTIELEQANVPCDLILHIERHHDGLATRLAYDTTLFDSATAARMMQEFCTLVSGIAADPDARVSRVPLLGPAERSRRLETSRGPAPAYPECTIAEAFEAVAEVMPGRIALVSEHGDEVSYAELDRRSDRLARALASRGVGAADAVGILADRSVPMIVAALAVLKAGGAYLPLDPSHPSSRRAQMLELAAARLLVCDRDVAPSPVPAMRLDERGMALESPGGSEVRARAGIDHPAYVCFTSGSTGTPKGVQVTHRGVLRLIFGRDCVQLGPDERILHLAPFAFDASTFEIWGALLHGGRLVLHPERIPTAGELQRTIARHGITTMWLTASLFNAIVDEAPFALEGLRQLLVGGEALSIGHVRACHRALPDVRLINGYGPTEATTFSCLFEIPRPIPEEWDSIPIGHSISSSAAYVLDQELEPTPPGVLGELYVGGDGLAIGYVGQPRATAQAFVPDPLGPAGRRLYRTGDLAAVTSGEAIECFGRRDHQVKIRGFRIELGEIESALLRHPNVREAAVVHQKSGSAVARLVACIAPRTRPAPELRDITTFLAAALPDYMLPAALVTLESLPRLSSQKIDRRTLSLTVVSAVEPGQDLDPPQGEIELALAEIWRVLLALERIGRSESFFSLGGHSILATQLAARIERRFAVSIPLRALMEEPTIEAMARHVAARGSAPEPRDSVLPAIVPAPHERGEPFPLTDIQQAYWIGRTTELPLGGVSSHGYQEVDVRDLDVPRLEEAFRRLIERHDMLRAVVDADGRQRVLASVAPFRIGTADLRALPEDARARALSAVREEMSHEVRPSDRWPLFGIRASLVDEHRTRLHLSTDALIGDAWSWRILGQELVGLYRDPDVRLEPIDIGFRDYVMALQALRTSRVYAASETYWRARLADLPPAPPLGRVDRQRSVAPRFSRRSGLLAPDVWQPLKAAAAAAGVSPTAILLSAFSEVIATWSGAQRFVLNLTVFNRLPLHPHVGRIVGDFTSLTLVPVDRRREAFAARAKRIQQELWDSLDHRYFTGVQVLRELRKLQPDAAAAQPVVFTSLLSQDLDAGAPLGEPVYGITQTPQVSLDHQVYEKAGGLAFNWDAVEEMFPDGCLDGMFSAYAALLHRLAFDAPAWQLIAGLIRDPDEERRALFNRTEGPVRPATLQGLFAERAAAQPDRTAVIAAARSLSYADLDRESDRLAEALRAAGAKPRTLVGVAMEKGWEQVVAVLGVLKAGAAYLPLDPALPSERLRHLIDHGRVEHIVTQPAIESAVEWPSGVTRAVVEPPADSAAPMPAVGRSGAEPCEPSPGDLAYVIYTSGSTGAPKGVMIDHRGAVNTVLDINERFSVGPSDRVVALSSLSFDLSVYDIFGALAAGATIVMPPPGRPDPAQWMTLVAAHEVTVWSSVPALMELLVEYAEQAARRGSRVPPSLRLIMLSGDWIPVSLVPRMRALWPPARAVSLGGATEASIWSIAHPIDAVDASWRSVPYGRPLRNQTFHVLNSCLEPCPAGVTGELYIGGAGLAKGYWRDDEKTQAAFITHPDTGERLYRTGDLGRHQSDMTLEFLGRADFQVKVRGHRIELGEIEAALLEHPDVRAAVATAAGSDGARRLVAYVVPNTAPAPDGAALRAYLERTLPRYMIPSVFVPLDRLPLTGNGKVDRAALPVPAAPAASRPHAAAAPALVDRVAAILAGVLALGAVDPEANLLELGASSVELVRIVNALEGEYGARLRLEEIYANPTVAGIASAIAPFASSRSSAVDKAAQALARLKRLSQQEFQTRLESTGASA